jgi:hypothetical protein
LGEVYQNHQWVPLLALAIKVYRDRVSQVADYALINRSSNVNLATLAVTLLIAVLVFGLLVVRAATQIQFLSLICDIAAIAEKAETLAARPCDLNVRTPKAR